MKKKSNGEMRNLFYFVRKYWLLILAATIVTGIAAGAVGVYQNEKQQRMAESFMASQEYADAQKELEDLQEYYNESVKLRINPLKEYKNTLVYEIEAQDIAAFEAALSVGQLYADVADFLEEKLSSRCFSELVTINMSDTTATIMAIYDTEQGCKKLIDAIAQGVEEFAKQSGRDIHQLSQSEMIIVDSSITVYQATIDNQLAAAKTKAAADTSVNDGKNIGVIEYSCAGLVLGFFGILMVLCFIYLLNGRIKAGLELELEYAVPVLGRYDHNQLEDEDMMVQKLQLMCEKSGKSSIAIIGDRTITETDAAICILKEKSELTLEAVPEDIRTAEDLAKIGNIGNVLFIVAMNHTKTETVKTNIRICREIKSNILGAIIIEGK